MNKDNYKNIASLFSYPEEQLKQNASKNHKWFKDNYSDCDKAISFLEFLENTSISELQENYIFTFDVNAASTLDIGFVLFGEDLKRGEFLLKLKEEHTLAGNDCGTELADHLPNILNLISASSDEDFLQELVSFLLIPVLKTQIKEFKLEDSPYKKMYEFLLQILISDFGDSPEEEYKILNSGDCLSSEFKQSCSVTC